MYAQIIDWEDELIVAPNDFGNVRPRIVLTNNNQPLVLFGKSSLGLYVSKLENNVFSQPILIHPSDVSVYMSNWTSGDIASNGDTVVVVFKSNPLESGRIYSVSSFDGGNSFTDTVRADTHSDGVAWLPCIEMDNEGNPILAYMAHDPVWLNPKYVYSKSFDAGESYSNEIDITSGIGEEACDCCPAELVSSNGKEVLLFRNVEQSIRDIHAVYSSDNGNSFQHYINTEDLNWVVNSCPSTAPDGIFVNDRLFSVSASRASGKLRVYLSESLTNDSIIRISTDSIFPPDNFNGSQNYPRISAFGDTVAVVWQESNPSNFDVFLSLTVNGNTQELLNQKILVNMDVSGAQLNPDVVISDGYVHVVFQDNNGGVVKYRKGKISSLGINYSDASIRIYPNPADEFIQIDGLNKFINDKIKVFNSNGQLVHQKKIISDQLNIELKDIKSGNYTIHIGQHKSNLIVNKH